MRGQRRRTSPWQRQLPRILLLVVLVGSATRSAHATVPSIGVPIDEDTPRWARHAGWVPRIFDYGSNNYGFWEAHHRQELSVSARFGQHARLSGGPWILHAHMQDVDAALGWMKNTARNMRKPAPYGLGAAPGSACIFISACGGKNAVAKVENLFSGTSGLFREVAGMDTSVYLKIGYVEATGEFHIRMWRNTPGVDGGLGPPAYLGPDDPGLLIRDASGQRQVSAREYFSRANGWNEEVIRFGTGDMPPDAISEGPLGHEGPAARRAARWAQIRGASLLGAAVALHALEDRDLRKTALDFGKGIAYWEAGKWGAIGAAGLLGGRGAARVVAAAVPVVGEVILATDILATLTIKASNWWFGLDMTWGDVWDAWAGNLDKPTFLAGPPPPADFALYYD